jgi:uncharacterized protein YdhG (YjbR/CyaY superfamily)
MEGTKFTTVDEYIASLPKDRQVILQKMRETIRKAAPDAEESISYAMPAFKQNGVICWFAAAKNHYALYIVPKLKNVFKEKLSEYSQTKSAIHFKYDQAMPVRLISEIVRYKVKDNMLNKQNKK